MNRRRAALLLAIVFPMSALGTAGQDVVELNRGLRAQRSLAPGETFLPASSTEFFGKGDASIRALFVRDDTGRPVEVVLISAGQATRPRRAEPVQ